MRKNCSKNLVQKILVPLVIALIFVVIPKDFVSAITSQNISFQGKIVRNDTGYEGLNVTAGSPACVVSGSQDTCDFRVSYYTAISGGTLLFTEDFTNVEIGNYGGVFDLSLGSGSASTTSACSDGTCNTVSEVVSEFGDVYIQIQFAPDGSTLTETFARMPLEASAYSMVSQKAKGDERGFVFNPLSSAPTTTEGKVYYDSGSQKLKLYTGSSWTDIATGGSSYWGSGDITSLLYSQYVESTGIGLLDAFTVDSDERRVSVNGNGAKSGLSVYSSYNASTDWPLVSFKADGSSFSGNILQLVQDGTGKLITGYKGSNLEFEFDNRGDLHLNSDGILYFESFASAPTSLYPNSGEGCVYSYGGDLYWDAACSGSGEQLNGSTGGTSLWTDGGNFTYLTSDTDDLVLGASTISSSTFFFDIDGSGGNYLEIDNADNTSRLFTISNTGNIGIGTSSPSAKLDIGGSSSVLSNLVGNITITPNNNLILSSGSFGIGTTSPNNKLHIEGINNGDAGIYINNAVPYTNTYTLYNSEGILYWGGSVVGSMMGNAGYLSKFATASTLSDSVVYESGGNLGIGTTTTTHKLNINGNIGVNGSLVLTPQTSMSITSEGILYYDGDVDHLFISTGDNSFHRLAMDMTKYSSTSSSVGNGSYIELSHNQNTNDINIVAWVKDKITGLWKTAVPTSNTVKQSLQNEFEDSSSAAKIRTVANSTSVGMYRYVDTGNGSDGSITVYSIDSESINQKNYIAGRNCSETNGSGGDAPYYSVSALTSNTATLTSAPSNPSCLKEGDEVLIINLQGSQSSVVNVGNYETLHVASISGNVVTFVTSKEKYYGESIDSDNNIGSGADYQKVMLQRVPNYSEVSIEGSFYSDPYDYVNGVGGVMFFRASNMITISGNLSTSEKGYSGGTSISSLKYGPGQGLFYANDTSGQGGDTSVTVGYDGSYSGGGGGGKSGTGNGGAGGGGADILGASGGGAGGTVNRYSTSAGGIGGGGGGGGNATAGDGGLGYFPASSGSDLKSGAGSEAGKYSGGQNSGGGGGGGAGNYSADGITKLNMGGGGGGGGAGMSSGGTSYAGSAGGNGGGIIYVAANVIDLDGSIQSDGGDGLVNNTTYSGGGGGGAGGTILLLGNSVDLTNGSISADGGVGGDNQWDCNNDGGVGGDGYISAYSDESSLADITSQPYYSYGIYNSPVISTPNATSLTNLRWESNTTLYGKVSFQTRTGNSTDPTDGTWEAWKPMISGVNYMSLQDADNHTDWSGVYSTVQEGDIIRDVPYFEDEDESTAANITKIVSSSSGAYVEANMSSKDISSYDYLTFWIRASESGSTVQFGLGENTSSEQKEEITIDNANTWQKVYWDLSDIPSASIDNVTKLRITNLAYANTIYIDNVRVEKLISDESRSVISSTPNNYFQYRIIFTTTNKSYQPQVENISFTFENGYKIVQNDSNTIRVYNNTGEDIEMKVEAIVYGADLAEWYTVDDQSIEAGDLVAISGEKDTFGVPILRKSDGVNDPMLIGAISTKAGQELGLAADNRRLLGLDGRIPVKVELNSEPINKGDYITSSSTPGMARKARPGELSIGRAFEDWNPNSDQHMVLIIINDVSQAPFLVKDIFFGSSDDTNLSNYGINIDGEVFDYSEDKKIYGTGVFAEAAIGNVVSGSIFANEINSNDQGILTIKGNSINIGLYGSEYYAGNNIGILDPDSLGVFNFLNEEGDIVSSIKSNGDAYFSGSVDIEIGRIEDLTTGNLNVTGTLHVENLSVDNMDSIKGLDLYVKNQVNSVLGDLYSRSDIYVEQLINNYRTEDKEKTDSIEEKIENINSDLLSQINDLKNQLLTLKNINTNSDESIKPLSLRMYNNSLVVDSDMTVLGTATFKNINIGNIFVNSTGIGIEGSSCIDESGEPMLGMCEANTFFIQKNNSGNVNYFNGKIVMYPTGKVKVNEIEVNESSHTIGVGNIKAGTTSIVINSDKIANTSKIFLTPTSNTKGQNVFVSGKVEGESFTVSISEGIDTDITFDWFIVNTSTDNI